MDNKIVSLFFGTFESPYIGSPFMVNGNQIYSAIIKEKGLDYIKNAFKVSHGVFHTINKNSTNWYGHHVSDEIKLDNKAIRTYNDFFQLRDFQTPFLKDIADRKSKLITDDAQRIIKKHTLRLNQGEKLDIFHVDRLSFFIISDKQIELEKISLGAKRNLGFGSLKITNSYSLDLNSLVFSEFSDNEKLILTAKNGIMGVLNHQKYGYGEFKIENWKEKGWLIRLITPLCLESTIETSRHYSQPPDFMLGDVYRKHKENIWKQGKVETLYCISDGCVFKYGNN